jgi:hypothetical protein
VCLTPRGRAALRTMRASALAVEDAWRQRLGAGLRGMYADDPLAFEVCVRHVASIIEDQRRSEGKTDPRDNAAS